MQGSQRVLQQDVQDVQVLQAPENFVNYPILVTGTEILVDGEKIIGVKSPHDGLVGRTNIRLNAPQDISEGEKIFKVNVPHHVTENKKFIKLDIVREIEEVRLRMTEILLYFFCSDAPSQVKLSTIIHSNTL